MADSWQEIDGDGFICDWDNSPNLIGDWHALEMTRRGLRERQEVINFYYGAGFFDFAILQNPFSNMCGDLSGKLTDLLTALLAIRNYYGVGYLDILGIDVYGGHGWEAPRLGAITPALSGLSEIEKLRPVDIVQSFRTETNKMKSIIPYPIIDPDNPPNLLTAAMLECAWNNDGSALLYTRKNEYTGGGWVYELPYLGGVSPARIGAKNYHGTYARGSTRVSLLNAYHTIPYDINMFGATGGVFLTLNYQGDLDYYGNDLGDTSKLRLLRRVTDRVDSSISSDWFSSEEGIPSVVDAGYQISGTYMCVTQEPHFAFHA